ncbi:MAG: HAMP domain-containing protein, partial [Anaerolineae bacterium]|nr:HAMP domain-containing protein [Anaerolineae bacterium]
MRKFNLSFMAKVTIMVVVFILLTAATVSLTNTASARSLLVENKLSELGSDVEINSVRLLSGIDALKHDTIFLSNLPEVQGVRRAIEAGGVDPVDLTTDALWRTQLIGVFSELLVSKPHYVRLQYTSTQDALELVRVENSDGVIRALGRRELNIGVQDDYFLAAQALAPGAVYLSDIELQRDNGELVDPQTIVMYASTPIYSDDGSVFGVISIGLNFGETFSELLALKKSEEALYVTNQAGDFLLNSADPALAFGFETGQQYRIQDTFETLAPLFAPGNTLQELPASPDTASNATAVHFRRVAFDQLSPDRYLGIAIATPYSAVVGAVDRFVDQVALLTAVLVTGGVILAVVVMRNLIRPLYQITLATQQISEGHFDVHLPIHSQDEFGQLARGFNQMAEAVHEREQVLTEFNESLEQRIAERTFELRQARDEALAAQRIANENARLKSEFLATMSHELRTPMNAIEGFTSIILSGMGGVEFNEKTGRYVQRVNANSKRLLGLINDFLDLSRIESGRLELANLPFSPRDAAMRWQEEIGVLAQKKNLNFEVSIDPDIPETVRG